MAAGWLEAWTVVQARKSSLFFVVKNANPALLERCCSRPGGIGAAGVVAWQLAGWKPGRACRPESYRGFSLLRTETPDLIPTRKMLPKAWRDRVCRPGKAGRWLAGWRPGQACRPKKIVVKNPNPGPTRKILLEAGRHRAPGLVGWQLAGWMPGQACRPEAWGPVGGLLVGCCWGLTRGSITESHTLDARRRRLMTGSARVSLDVA